MYSFRIMDSDLLTGTHQSSNHTLVLTMEPYCKHDYIPFSLTVGNTGQEYSPSSLTVGNTGQEYSPSSLTVGNTGQEYSSSSLTVGNTGQEYSPSSLTVGNTGQDYSPFSLTLGNTGQHLKYSQPKNRVLLETSQAIQPWTSQSPRLLLGTCEPQWHFSKSDKTKKEAGPHSKTEEIRGSGSHSNTEETRESGSHSNTEEIRNSKYVVARC